MEYLRKSRGSEEEAWGPPCTGRTHPRRVRLLMQVLLAGGNAKTGLSPVLRRVGGAAGEHLIDEGGRLADLGGAQVAREKGPKVVYHALPLPVAGPIRRRPHQNPPWSVPARLLAVA